MHDCKDCVHYKPCKDWMDMIEQEFGTASEPAAIVCEYYKPQEEAKHYIFDKDKERFRAKSVVYCAECVLHDNCSTEDVFKFSKYKNPFCCAGKKAAE